MVRFDEAVRSATAALKRPLPGARAHARLAPRPPRQWPPGFDRAAIREAAALLLLFPIDDRAHIVLTVRAHTLERHGGQVSLPGGVIDPGESREHAALREAHEEIGLDISAAHTLGALTPLEIPVSGFRVHPVVAAAPLRPRFVAAEREVARVLEVDLERLLDPQCLVARDVVRDGRTETLPAFLIDGVEVWGATAMVLAEFVQLISGPF